ncbi:hypothetical protein [Chryseobacterium populi]|uniref:Uncharacterized protein n=1 Tax=Chryseobacterium populi TaxID=1144316 RepID=J3CJP2_9FLAO|nr:hypothetical protein [Chryseobacterium populi]EJL72856.1 hypothetical protein PMI13_01753 [Chryseobacterium populi]
MKVRCISNKGEFLREYEYKNMFDRQEFGRFGASANSEYNDLVIGNEYIVMGIIIFQTYQAYLLDDNEFVFACPCQLFEILENKLENNWEFRLIEKGEEIYPYIQAIIGYSELCINKKAYENLIIEKDEDEIVRYFEKKAQIISKEN